MALKQEISATITNKQENCIFKNDDKVINFKKHHLWHEKQKLNKEDISITATDISEKDISEKEEISSSIHTPEEDKISYISAQYEEITNIYKNSSPFPMDDNAIDDEMEDELGNDIKQEEKNNIENMLKDKIEISKDVKNIIDYIHYFNIPTDILLATRNIAYELFNCQGINLSMLCDEQDENLVLGIYIKDMDPIEVSDKLDILYEKLYNEFSDEDIDKFIIHVEFI
ncbi:MAG: hypothetical protein ABRQ39_09585 [Candidatus Eremiobacterota bacterium]